MNSEEEEFEEKDVVLSRDNAFEIIGKQISMHNNIQRSALLILRLIVGAVAIGGVSLTYNVPSSEVQEVAESVGVPALGVRGTVEQYNMPMLVVALSLGLILFGGALFRFYHAAKGDSYLQPNLGSNTPAKIKIAESPTSYQTNEQLMGVRFTNKKISEWIDRNSKILSKEHDHLQKGSLYLVEGIMFILFSAFVFFLMSEVALIPILILNVLVLAGPILYVLGFLLSFPILYYRGSSFSEIRVTSTTVISRRWGWFTNRVPLQGAFALGLYGALYCTVAIFSIIILRYYSQFLL